MLVFLKFSQIVKNKSCQVWPYTSNEVDRSLTHAVGLVDIISYVASRTKKSSKLGLKMALYAWAI